MIFETVSGSTYEIDIEGKRVRRLSGSHPVTSRQSEDGCWQSYVDAWTAGLQIFFCWDESGHGTLTSPLLNGDEVLSALEVEVETDLSAG